MAVAVFCFAAAVFFSFFPGNIFEKNKPEIKNSVKGISINKIISTPTPQDTPTPGIVYQVIQKPSTTTQQPPTSTPAPTVQQATNNSNPQPTSAPSQAVNMQVTEPDGTFNFTVNLNSGNTACDLLNEAKQEGKIKSVTMDDSYMSTLHSPYIKEINGYQNNWTFTVNGSSPQGCALYSPKAGDSIVWKFG